jgi:hypothetical protein
MKVGQEHQRGNHQDPAADAEQAGQKTGGKTDEHDDDRHAPLAPSEVET